MKIHQLIWPEDRVEHVALHGIEPEEVEEVCFGQALLLRAKSKEKNPCLLCSGPDSGGTVSVLCGDSIS